MEQLTIAENTLYKLLSHTWEKPVIDGFQLIESVIQSSDDEDGGGEYEFVIQRLSDDKYFKGTYCDWDIENTEYNPHTHKIGERCDLTNILQEVFKAEKTIIYYK